MSPPAQQASENDTKDEVASRANIQFKNYKEHFESLLISDHVPTRNPIVSCIITYDSSRVITVTKNSDKRFLVRQFDLNNNNENCFNETIGGDENCFIRAKEVEQNIAGDKYAIVYYNDGRFLLRVFDKNERPAEQCEAEDHDLNKHLGIDRNTMPIEGFNDPFVNCAFVNDDHIAVSLFYNRDCRHYHFIVDHARRTLLHGFEE